MAASPAGGNSIGPANSGASASSSEEDSSEDDCAFTGFLAATGLLDCFDGGFAAAFGLGGGASSSELDSSSPDELSGNAFFAATTGFFGAGAGYFFGAGFLTSSSDDDSSSLEDYGFFYGFFAGATGFLVVYEAGDLTGNFLVGAATGCLDFVTALAGCFLGGGRSSDSLSYSPLELDGSITFFLLTALL